MGADQVRLSPELQQVIEQQVAAGRVESADAYLEAAVLRYAEDLELEDDLIIEANGGIADIEAGRYRTIATPEDAEAWHQEKFARLRDRLAADERCGDNPVSGSSSK
jgi:Arc/MetJ-type ribon-helix-helix transcriptional regulator